MKYLNSAIKWRWLSTMHIFSQNNQKIGNGSKKTFMIIPKSTKIANVFFHEWFPIYGVCMRGRLLCIHIHMYVCTYTCKLWLLTSKIFCTDIYTIQLWSHEYIFAIMQGIFIDSNNACMQSCTFGRHNIMFGTNLYICSDTEIV